MNKLYAIAAAMLLSVFASSSQAADVSLSMVYTNALGERLPFEIFTEHEWAPDSKARFVKLHMYFDEPIKVKEVRVHSCDGPLKSDISVFVNFDSWIWSPGSGQYIEEYGGAKSTRIGDWLAVTGMERKELRSLTINFEKNSGFKLCGIDLLDLQGKEYTIHTPALVPGNVTASSTLSPASAYAPIYLFDSRFEYGWASNKQAKNVDLSFDFDAPKRVERIRIWNGYQRSEVHCIANSRVKTLHVTGDGGYDEQITVKDELGSQVILLPKPFEGKHLKFTVVDSFRGKSYPDLVISELRFYDGKEWFMLDPSEKLKQNIAENRAKFTEAGVQALLNDSYSQSLVVKRKEGEYVNSYSDDGKLRLRADGSFYVGYSFAAMAAEGSTAFFALGNYEIKKVNKGRGLKMRIFGLRYDNSDYGDCNGCGRDCNKVEQSEEDGPPERERHYIFQETVSLRPLGGGKYKFVNESGKTLGFGAMELTREK